MPQHADTTPPSEPRAEPDGRATRWDDHKANRRDRILDAAMDAIDELGPDVGVKLIAERAELPRSVVYRVFQDRSDLDEQLRSRILERLMQHVTPALTPAGTVAEAIDNAVDNYLTWIVEAPHLHQFLGTGSPSQRTTGSRAVTGTKTAIAVRLTGLLESVLHSLGKDTDIAETLAFGLIGLVDVSVNRWRSNPDSALDVAQLREFLTASIWLILDGNLRRIGAELDPTTPLADLT